MMANCERELTKGIGNFWASAEKVWTETGLGFVRESVEFLKQYQGKEK